MSVCIDWGKVEGFDRVTENVHNLILYWSRETSSFEVSEVLGICHMDYFGEDISLEELIGYMEGYEWYSGSGFLFTAQDVESLVELERANNLRL